MLASNQNLLGEVQVGTLIALLIKDQINIAFNFRETGNKVIHSDDIGYFKADIMSGCFSYEVTLYGIQQPF